MNEKQIEISPKGSIKELIQSSQFKSAVASALPQHLTPDRFVRIALTAITRTPKLLECDKESIFKCMLQLSQFGLEPDGRNAHLIPFWNSNRKTFECQLIIDYKGLVDLAMRSGNVSYIFADKVCENDEFEYDKGQVKVHKIDFKEDRGAAYAYYAIVRNKDGTERADAMTKADVEKIRQRSKAKDSGPWMSDFDEMAKKTVFRRLSKWIQLSPEYRDALEADVDKLEEMRFENAIPISRPVIGSGEQEGGAVEAGQQWSEAMTPSTATEDKKFTVATEETAPPIPPKYRVAPERKPTLTRKKRSEYPQAKRFSQALDAEKISPQAFVETALAQGWIDETERMNISEEKLAYFLEPQNWEVIIAELKERKQ